MPFCSLPWQSFIDNKYFVDHCFVGSIVLFVTGIIQNVVMYRRYNCPTCMDSSQLLAGIMALSMVDMLYVQRVWRRRVSILPRNLLLSLRQRYDSMWAHMCRSDDVKASIDHLDNVSVFRMFGLDGPDVACKQYNRVAIMWITL